MEVTDNNLQQLASYLQQTLSPDPTIRRGAEKFLESIERNQNYSLLLLNLIDKPDVAMELRTSASITFKNFIKRNWAVVEEDRIYANDRQFIKQSVVGVMLKSPDQIQKQLSDAISIIGKEDFPEKWPGLLDEMIQKFQTADYAVINGILHTAFSIFKRYRSEFKSEKLWREIKFVLDKFCTPLTTLTTKLMELSETPNLSPNDVKFIFNSLHLISQIFYDLNFQDLPEFFEDNMATWMGYFHVLLTRDVQIANDTEEAGVVEELKTQICDNLSMYAQKYDEEFSTHLPTFVLDVWHLLSNTSLHRKYDQLVSNAIQFLATVAERPSCKHLFDDPNTLSSLCEKVIVPNMEFRESDEEAFEDNADEYIRRDIEGSDVDTRRRAACDLVKALSRSFEEVVLKNFSVYIEHMLKLFQEDPKKNWKSKDAAIFLVTSLAVKGQTQKHGTTQTSQLINVTDFFNSNIFPHFQAFQVEDNPVLRADVIKYVMVFRNQLPHSLLISCLPALIHFLISPSQVVHSYSASCIEKLLTLKPPCITKNELTPYSESLIKNLFLTLTFPNSQENDYVMKCIMKTFNELQDVFLPHLNSIVTSLLEKLTLVSKNPSNPNFNHYLFEVICLVISVTCKFNPNQPVVSSFEQPLFPLFQNILQQDVQEFVPYIFQVLSLMLEMHQTSIPEPYMALFPLLLQPLLWERHGNIPALARLIQVYVSLGFKSGQISQEKLPGILGIFQKLLASKSNDHFGMQLLYTLLIHVTPSALNPFFQQIFVLLFQKLTSSKTVKFVRCVIVFFSLFIHRESPSSFYQIIERIQTKMFGMVIEKIFLAESSSLPSPLDKKLACVAMTKMLCQPFFLKDPSYDHLWLPTLQKVIECLETSASTSQSVQENKGGEMELLEGFQASYSQLIFAAKPEKDYCSEISDARLFLAKSLATSGSQEIKLKLTGLPSASQTCLGSYLSTAGVVLA